MTPDQTRSFTKQPGDPDPAYDTTAQTAVTSAATPTHQTDAPPGYEIESELGRGGMGVVYKARQVGLNRTVALKMILSGAHASERDMIRFLAEAEAVAAIQHPHVVQVFEIGNHAARPYMALEYCDGGALTAWLKTRGRLPPNEAAELLEQIARGVAAAHDLGIVHRDLKPGNVLLSPLPKVADFGLAKKSTGEDLTHTGAVMGTPAYMAPEQAKGETKFVGPAADVYALGAMLFECLTGRPPFTGNVVDLLVKVAEEEPPSVRSLAPGTPRDLALICEKCLAKLPHERYATAGELADELRRFAAGEPVTVRTAGVVEKAAKWARRKPTLAAAYGLTLAVLVLAGFGTALAVLLRDAVAARAQAESAQGQAETARDELAKTQEKLARVEYGRSMQVAHQEWRDNNLGASNAILDAAREDLRGWEWHYLHRLCHSDLVTFRGHYGSVTSASFSPDGSRVLTVSQTAKVWDARTGVEVLTLKGNNKSVASATFSADGSRLATANEGRTARIWDARTGAELLALTGHTNFVRSVSFSADGSRVVTGSIDKTAIVWDARTAAAVITLKGHTGYLTSASFSPDGSRVVTGSLDKTARVWDATTGAEVLTLKGHTSAVPSASFSPDGSRVVTGSWDMTARIWDAATGAEVLTLKGHTNAIESASFSADGSRVVTGSFDKTAKVWDARTGAAVTTLTGHTAGLTSAALSADGSRVVTGSEDNTAKVWDATTGAEVLTLKGHNVNGHGIVVTSASFSADGSRIVTGSGDRTAKVWDATTGAEVLTLKGHTEIVLYARFSADGTRVVTGCVDGTAKVWDARSGVEVLTLKGHAEGVRSASFSADGSRVVTAGADKTVRVWDARPLNREFLPKGLAPVPRAVAK